MHILFLSCLKASELIEKRFDIRLTLGERIQLRMHKTMCSACSLYDKQSTLIENGFSNIGKAELPSGDIQHLKKIISQRLSDSKKA